MSNQRLSLNPSAPSFGQLLNVENDKEVNFSLLSHSISDPSFIVPENTSPKSYSEAVKNNPVHNHSKLQVGKSDTSKVIISRTFSSLKNSDNADKTTSAGKRRRGKPGIVGNRITNKGLKSANRPYDLYIGNCSLEMNDEIIKDYVKSECNILLKDCKELSVATSFSKSFKLTTTYDEREILLKPEFWPKGILCRKFYNSSNKD